MKDSKVDPLQGKDNWPTWLSGTEMRLRGEKVAYILNKIKPLDPETVEELEIATHIVN